MCAHIQFHLYVYVGSYNDKDTSLTVNEKEIDSSLQQKGSVTLSVTDTGAGISEENLQVSPACHVLPCPVTSPRLLTRTTSAMEDAIIYLLSK